MSLTAFWNKAQPLLREKVGDATYEKWFLPLKIKERSPQHLTIETPDEFFKGWIVDRYKFIIDEALKDVSSQNISFDFEVNPLLLQNIPQTRLAEFTRNPEIRNDPASNLNPRFTFENFVVGSSNRFAHAACLGVAESPAKAYNPLFIYGKVGLGKTHLMQAVANKIKELNPRTRHCYLSSEKFTNELIDAIRHRSTTQFRQKYRGIDVLLIDDIHFIAGKESTQEEFFNTFNALHNERKQIIISSDRPPKEIANLEERLRSRFAWGLITDIQPPDYETRVAILRKKIEREPVSVPDEVLSFIAEEIKSNIRELEGALIRVVAYSLLEEKPVSLEMAKLILKDLIKETLKTVNADTIQKMVAEFFSVTILDLKTHKRNKAIVLPRQVAMYLTRQLTALSLPEIGSAFGGKDHTTVLYAWKKIDADLKKNTELKNTVNQLITTIQQ